MDLIRFSITRPVTVIVGALLVVMFGLIGLSAIPVQLTPTVDRPKIDVTTRWPGRSPQEIVDEIVREQEEQLKNVANLRRMRSTSTEGEGKISLEFTLGSDINRALQEVSDALRQVPSYPDDVDEPTIESVEGSAQTPVAWVIIDLNQEGRAKFPDFDVATLYDAVDKQIKPFIERIDGVGAVAIYGGRQREVQVLIDPQRLARRGLTYGDVITALRGQNRNTSAGTIAEGKLEYRVRVVGQYTTARDVLETVVAYRPGADGALRPVYVSDVADVEIDHQKKRGFVRSLASPCIAFNVQRQTNANVIRVMDALKVKLEEVRKDILPRLDPTVGPYIELNQVYDETVYIHSAIDLVKGNVLAGGLLAAVVLILFLRSLVSTGIIAVVIPISVIGSFMFLWAFGRTLNVISLAGLALTVGMGIDNAIVVLENISRRRALGDPPFQAAYRGTREVWGAVLASALTNIAVFLPIILIQEESGQLFRDISLAATAAVVISLGVAVTLVPVAAARLMGQKVVGARHGRLRTAWDDLFGLVRLCAWGGAAFSRWLYWGMSGWRAWTVRPAIILGMSVASVVGAVLLMPPMDYLPAGNQNLVFGFMLVPPGYSIEQQTTVAKKAEAVLMPYANVPDDPAEINKLPPIFRYQDPQHPFAPVPIENLFMVGFNGGMFGGLTSRDPDRVLPLATLLSNAMSTTSPGVMGFGSQASIFAGGLEQGNVVSIDITGPSLEKVTKAAGMMQMLGFQQYGFVRPDPMNFDLKQPEWQVRVNRQGRELGVTAETAGTAVRALFDGAYVDDFFFDADTVDLVLLPKGGRLTTKEELASIPIATPRGPVVPMDSVLDVYESGSSPSILRVEEEPAISLVVTKPDNQPLEQVMADIRANMIEPARQAGLLDSTMAVRLEGSAAKLDEVRGALFGVPEPGPWSTPRKALFGISLVILGVGVAICIYALVRCIGLLGRRGDPLVSRRASLYFYGSLGALSLGAILFGLLAGFASQPQLLEARFVWALAVTYLLMCSLYESFFYPLVIMFSVPLAIVGGFAGLRIVHDLSMADPTKPPQMMDVLTMLGFIILIGVVVNNAILIVEQSLNLMEPWRLGDAGRGEQPMKPLDAIAESVRTRLRPIFMSTLTTVVGMLPLVFSPGAGSEMYRGMGAVIIGGQLVSTAFTLVLVPMVFSVVIQMRTGLHATLTGDISRGIEDELPQHPGIGLGAAPSATHASRPHAHAGADAHTNGERSALAGA